MNYDAQKSKKKKDQNQNQNWINLQSDVLFTEEKEEDEQSDISYIYKCLGKQINIDDGLSISCISPRLGSRPGSRECMALDDNHELSYSLSVDSNKQ